MGRTNRKTQKYPFKRGWKMVKGICGYYSDVLTACGDLLTDAV